MKIKYKLTAIIFFVILLVSVTNYKLLTDTFETVQLNRLESAEVLFGRGVGLKIYRMIIEGKNDEVTALLFSEKLLRERKIEYMLVFDHEGKVFSNTFLVDLPQVIYDFDKTFDDEQTYRIDDFLETDIGVYNVALPIREGIEQVGTLHIGITKKFIEDISTPIQEASEKTVLLSIAVIIVGALLSFGLSSAITRSLSRLKELAIDLSNGKYDVEIDKLDGEVGMVADAFRVMRDNIKEAQRKLKDQNVNLEHLVKERTQKLEETNREMLLSHEQLEEANHDLDQQKENLRIIFSAMDYPLYVVNKDYSIAMMNDKAKEYIQPEMVSPFSCYSLVHKHNSPCDENEEDCPMKTVIETGVPAVLEHNHIDEEGNQQVVEVRAFPIFDEDGEVVQIVESCIDVSEKKSAEQEQLRLERELSRAHKLESIGTLAAGVAHEINTPIQFIGDNTQFAEESVADLFGAIASYQKLLEDLQEKHGLDVSKSLEKIEDDGDLEYLVDELPKSLKQTLDGVGHVTDIVKAMKDFSHIGSSEDMQKEDMNHAIETTITISKNEWKYVADIDRDLDDLLPQASCYIGEIKQVLLNLIVNAAHTIKDKLDSENSTGKGLIKIRTYQEGETVVIAITDSGMGVPEEHKDNLFVPFYTTKEVSKGTGQGLSVAYNIIVEKHGGKIWFETEQGVGTTFFIALNHEGLPSSAES